MQYALTADGTHSANTGPNDEVWGEWGLDLDAQFVSSGKVLAWWFGGFGFFASIYLFASSTNPEGQRVAVCSCFPDYVVSFSVCWSR